MEGLVEMLGDKLVGKKLDEGHEVETQSLVKDGGVVGLYFSAHWCPPCRGFTPKLTEFYNNFKKANASSGKFLELVFVSSDRDQSSFDEYFGEMPFLALPYEDRDRKGKLSKKFKVQGIPSLVFLDAGTGEVITTDGRTCVMEDGEGADFPWKPKSFSDIFTGSLLKKKADTADTTDTTEPTTVEEATKGKITGLYFSAHWCPPCRSFTPTLVEMYNKVRAQGKVFEMIFVSSDRSEEAFNEYYAEMPWLALPYGDNRKKLLSKHFQVEGIPTLVILGEDQEVIQKNGRAAVSADKDGKDFPWHPKPVNELDDMNAGAINDGATLIYFTGSGSVDGVRDLIYPIAEAYCSEHKQAVKEKKSHIEALSFLYETDKSDDIADAVRDYFKLPDRNPLVAILDITEKRKHELPEGEVTKERLAKLVGDFKAGTLEYKPMAM